MVWDLVHWGFLQVYSRLRNMAQQWLLHPCIIDSLECITSSSSTIRVIIFPDCQLPCIKLWCIIKQIKCPTSPVKNVRTGSWLSSRNAGVRTEGRLVIPSLNPWRVWYAGNAPSFVTTAPTYGDGRGIAGLMCGAVTFWDPPPRSAGLGSCLKATAEPNLDSQASYFVFAVSF